MIQLTTISASAAALNMENLKIPRRISTKDKVADVKADADRNARRAENALEPEAAEPMVPAAPLALDLLDAGANPRQQAASWFAEAAYREGD